MTPVVPFDSAWAETSASQKSDESTQSADSKTADTDGDKNASDAGASDEPKSDDPAASDSDANSPSASEPTDDAAPTQPADDAQPAPADDGISPLSDDVAVQSEEDEDGTGEDEPDPESGDKVYTESDFDPSEVGSVFALEHKEVMKTWEFGGDIYYSEEDFEADYGMLPDEMGVEPEITESKYSLVFQTTGENEASIGIGQNCATANRAVGTNGSATESAFGGTIKASSDLYDIIDFDTVYDQGLIPPTIVVPASVNVHGTTFNITSVADLAFAGTRFGVSEIRLPEGIQSIGSNNTEDTAYTGAFYRNTLLKTVNIPSTVTAIYDSTFYGCSGITEVTLPAALQTLGTGEFQTQQVFRDCNNLRKVTFEGTEANPSQLQTFGQGLFRGLNITEVNLGYGMKTTGVEMFYQCDNLTSITLPASLETLGTGTFRQCTNLKNIQLPNSLKTIGDYAFAEIDGITGVGDNPSSSFINLRIPTSVETIGANAFMGCSKMIQFNFSDTSQSNLTTIGDRAFYNANSLIMVQLPPKLKVLGTTNEASSPSEGSHVFTGTQIGNQNTPVIPATIESIGAAAFQGCTSLKNVRFAAGASTITKLNSYMFHGCTSFVNVYTGRQISDDSDGKLPASINEIGDYAFSGTPLKRIELSAETIGDFVFYNCRSLANVTLNEGIKTLGKTTEVQITGSTVNGGSQVFGDCIALTSIHIPAGIENYGSNLFRRSGISEITFAEGVTSTGDYMFNNLGSLYDVTLPASLGTNGGTIGTNMFNNCAFLENVTFEEGFTTAGDYMFNRCTSLAHIQLPSTFTTAGERMFSNCSSLTEIEIPCSIEHGKYMFAGSSVTNITFAEGCTKIAPYMLAGLKISSIELPDTLTELGEYAFKDCTGLTKITLPASLEVVGERIFDGCTNLANVEFAPGFKVIGPFMFEGFSEMKGITLPDTLTELGEGAFKDCTGLTSITLPSSLEVMGKNVFQGCTNLIDIKFAPGFKVIGDNMFEGFEKLQTIDLPDTLETLGSYAFKDCVNLQSVKLPASLKNVGDYVFQGCDSLETVEFGEGYSVVGAYMFNGLTGLKNITLPNTLTEVGAYAFENCSFVENVDLTKVEKIGEGAFKGCAKITEINLKSVKEIGTDAFAGTNITRLTMPDNPIEGLTVGSFADCKKLIYVNMGGAVNVDDAMFEGCDNLETVVLPSVTSIGESAFADCPNLASIDLTNVSSIGDSAFSNCAKLAHINLSSVTSIGANTFDGCSMLTDVDLSNIGAIGAFAFNGCASITEANLENVISIGDSAFAGTGLASVSLGAGLDEVGNNVFANCADLTTVDLEEGIIVDATHMFANCPNLTTVNFVPVSEARAANFFSAIASFFSGSSDGLATLGANMFENCAKLANIDLTKVGVIGQDCFKGCTALTSADLTNATSVHTNAFADSGLVNLRMPDAEGALNLATMAGAENLETLDMGAITQVANGLFVNCTSLKTLVMDSVQSVPDQAFYHHPTLESISLKSAQNIGANAFANCSTLNQIELGNLKTIGNSAFLHCTSLASIDLSTVTSIGNNAFGEYVNGVTGTNVPLTEVVLGDNVTIGDSAFAGLEHLTSLTIGSGSTLHTMAFRWCSALTEVNIGANSDIGRSAFSSCHILPAVSIGDNSVIGISSFSDCPALAKVELGTGVSIGNTSFNNASSLSDINLENVTYIGSKAFNGCTKITEADLTNVTSIANDAFNGAYITSIIMPMTPDVIDFTDFDGRDKIVSVDMGAATEIGINQFKGCSKLATVILRNVKTIKASAFEGLTTLKQIDLSGVETIGDKAFANTGLESIVLPGTLGTNGGTVGTGIFENCTRLASATLGTPDSKLPSVTDNMFKGCTSLVSIDLTNAGPVGDNAFQGCTSLADVVIGSVDAIGNDAFNGCASLANIDLSKVKTIGDSAFAGCSSMDVVDLGSATAIQSNAFANASIKRLTLPANPAVIDFSAFGSCTDLEYVDLGGATTVVEAMFAKCANLTEVKLNNVTSIADRAFDGCSKLESVDISKVTSIGDSAFRGCALLSDIDLSGVGTVGATAFGGCNALGDIDLSTATSLGANAFSGTNVTSVVLGTNLSHVGASVFSGCSNLASITLPEGMTETGMFMFSGCNALTSVTIPASLGAAGSTIGVGMFQGCANLSDVKLGTAEAPLTIIGERMFDGCDALETIDLSHVESIGDSAFANCEKITEVDLTNVTYVAPNAFHNANIVRLTLPMDTAIIDFSAFAGCDKLEYVDLGGATSISDSLFTACTNLKEVNLRDVTQIGANAFKGCADLATISLEKIEAIGDGAFEGCTKLADMDLKNVKTIGSRAFANCTGIEEADLTSATSIATDAFNGAAITKIVMPTLEGVIDFAQFDNSASIESVDLGGLTTIADSMFVACANLNEVELRNVTKIGNNAFDGCAYLTAIDLTGVESIGNRAFAGSGLKNVVVPGTLGDNEGVLGTSMFEGCSDLATVQFGTDEAPFSTITDNMFKDCTSLASIDLHRATSIGNNAFEGCTALTEVTVPSTAAAIGDSVFANCTGLTEAVLGSSTAPLTTVASNMFNGCSALKTVDLVNVETISAGAFNDCAKLEEVNLTNATSIAEGAFAGTRIKRLTLPLILEAVAAETFKDCDYLQYVNLGGVKEIGVRAFVGCENLATVVFNKVETIGEAAFENCATLASANCGSVKTISDSAFKGCVKLARVDLGNVTSLGANAFNGCTSIEMVSLSDGLSSVSDGAFEGCTALTSVQLPGAASVGNSTFKGCTALATVGTHDLAHIGDSAFEGCSALFNLDCTAVETIGDSAFKGCNRYRNGNAFELPVIKSIGSSAFEETNFSRVTIKSLPESMGDAVFRNCAKLASVTVPEGITVTSSDMFAGCNALTTVTFTANDGALATFGSNMFAGCANLSDIDLAKVKAFGDGALDGCTSIVMADLSNVEQLNVNAFPNTNFISLVLPKNGLDTLEVSHMVNFPTVSTLDLGGVKVLTQGSLDALTGLETVNINSVASIDEGVFTGSKTLKTVYNTSGSLKTIGASAFENCSALSTFGLRNVLAIGDNAFRGCKLLGAVNIEKASSIGSHAFASSGVTKLDIYDSLVEVGEGAFSNCENLSMLKVNPNTVLGADKLFSSCTKLSLVDISSMAKLTGNNMFENCTALVTLTLPTDVTISGDNMFTGCTSLATVDIDSKSVVSGNHVFEGCSALSTLQFGAHAEVTGESLFKDCTSLVSVELPLDLNKVTFEMFMGCTALESVIATNATLVDTDAFKNCENLKSFSGDSLVRVENGAFENCYKLSNVSTSKVTDIGDAAFKHTTDLEVIDLTMTEQIGESAFEGSGIKHVVLGAALEHAGDAVFSGCLGLVDIILGEGTHLESNEMFMGCSQLGSVTFGKNVQISGDRVFAKCVSLNNITVEDDDNVTIEGDYVFSECTALRSVKLPKSLMSGVGTFKDCTTLADVDIIPKNNTTHIIASRMFENCVKLNNIDLSRATSIGESAFEGCESLRYIDLSQVRSLDNSAFKGCKSIVEANAVSAVDFGTSVFVGTSLQRLSLSANLKDLGPSVVEGVSGTLSYVNLGGVTNLQDSTFENFALLETVDTSAVENIGTNAFNGCVALKTINMHSIKNMGENAFAGCALIEDADLTNLTQIVASAFENTSIKNLILPAQGIETLTSAMLTNFDDIVNVDVGGATKLSVGAFENCADLTTVKLNNVDTIDTGVFNTCTKLASIDFGNVKTIGQQAFRNCKALSSLINFAGVENIGSNAFDGCTALTELNLPTSIKSVGGSAFSGCSGITSLTFEEGYTTIGQMMFNGCSGLTRVELPGTLTNMPSNVFNACTALTDVVLGTEEQPLTTISASMFNGCTNLSNIDLSKVETIESEAFKGCISLRDMNLASATSIGRAFLSETQVQNLALSDNLKSLTREALEGCTTLQTIDFGGVEKIEDDLFVNSTSLRTIIVPTAMEVGNRAFSGCTSLSSITLPEGCAIGDGSFRYCSKITEIDLSTISQIGASAFESCEGLTKVDIAQAKSIGANAFSKCIVLDDVTIGAAESIGNGAFAGIPITSISLPATLGANDSVVGANIFQNCVQLTTVEVAEEITSIAEGMFRGCTALSTINTDNIATVGANAFNGCQAVTDVAMGNIANVGNGAFAGTSITGAVLPSLQAIGSGVFENCAALTAADLSHLSEPGFVLGADIFKGCSNLEDLTLSSNLTELGTSAFQGANKLAVIKFKGESANSQTSIPVDGFATAGATNLEKLVFYGTLLTPSNDGNSGSDGDGEGESDGETAAPAKLFGGDSVKTYVTVYYYDSLENLGADEEAGTYDKAAGYVCVPYDTKLSWVPAQHVADIFDSSNYYGGDEPCILNFDYDAVFTSGAGEPKIATWENSDDTTRSYFFDSQILAPEVELEEGPLYYTGEEVEPLKKVSLLGFELKPEQYRVTYENNVDAGEATVTVALLISGATRGTTTKTFTIEPADIEGVTVAPIAQQSYIGEGIEPELEVTFGDKTLEADVDYTLSYADNINVGEATVTLTGIGNFTGETSATFEIVQGVISNGTIEPLENVVYNGNPNEPALDVKMFEGTKYEKTLTPGVDYTVEYENNVNVGVATATIKGEGGYMGELSTTFNIVPKDVSDTELSEIEEQVYTGLALEPNFTLFDDERDANLERDVDYTVTYSNNTQTSANIGRNAPSINIKGKGNYTGSISVKFAIVARDIKDAAVSGLTDVTYTGMAFTPTPKVVLDEGTDNERDLDRNRHYIIEYQNNVDAGTATVIMSGVGDYTGSVTANFQIHPKNLDSATLSQIPDQIYAAEPLEPAFTVSDGAKTLVADRDYTVEYADNTNVGEATVTVTGINNYVGTRTLNFNIVARDIASADIEGYEDVVYKGSAYTPALDISFDKGKTNEKNLVEGADYTVAFSNNVNVGTATALVTGIGGYTGTQTVTFDIAPKSIVDNTVELVMTDTYTYRGSEITPDARLIDSERNGTALVKETDFKVSYENNLDAAAADSENPPTVKIEGTGNYTGEKTVNFTILTRNIDNAEIAGVEDTVYNRTAQKPVPIVKLDSGTPTARVLNADTDYTVTYTDNTDAGNAAVTIRGTGNYSGTALKTFRIAPKSITKVSITKPDDQTYTGDAMKPEIVVSDGDDVLVEDDEYKISYDSNTAVGIASVTVTGKGNYADSKTLEFNIKSRSISDAQVAGLSDVIYTGEEFTPEVVVAVGLKRLVLDTDYTVAYSDNKEAGEAKVTISGMGGYSGQATATFRIIPKSVQTIDVAALTDVTYTGDPLEPEVVLTDQERDCALELGTDYELAYSNNTNAATATSAAAPRVTISGKGNYQGSRNVTFTIAPRSVDDATINNVDDVTYTGTAFKPEPVVVLNAGEENEKTLLKNSEYTVEYVDNQNAGDATVIVHGIGNYTGSASKGFKIARKDISAVSFAEIPAQTYTGEQLKPVVAATDGTIKLVEGTDFTVGYDNNVSVGKATITVTGQGNYTGTQTLNFDINKQSIKGAKVMSVNDATYTGSSHTPEPVVILNGKVLTKETDYTVSYDNNLNAGKGTVTVTGVNGYSDSESVEFNIARKNIANGDVSVTGIDPATYTGEAITPTISITDTSRDVALTPETEFSVEFANNVNAATISDIKPPTATITGEGNYTGTRSVTFTIAPRTINDVVITGVSDVTYSGSAFEPEPTVELDGKALKKGTDYTVSYANNTNVGTATVTIVGIGNYQGTKDATFEIGGKDLTALDAPVIADQAYTGSAIEPAVSIMDGKKELVKDVDYTVTFADNVNVADTPVVTITGAGNYVGTLSTTFNIVPRAISSDGVRLQIASGNVYTGEQLAPAVNVTDMVDGNEVTLRQDVDYTITYTNNISAADADSYRAPSVTITGMGNYKGTQKGAFTIEPKDVESVTIEDIDDQSYAAGDDITPKVVVKDGEITLKLNTDYEIDYADNADVGTAKVSVVGIGNYAGTKESSFQIVSKDITKVIMASFEPQIYNGHPIEPEITLLDGNKTLEKDVDFKMDFTENTNAGMASATISGIGNYSGSRTVRFLISSKPLAGVEIADIPDEVYDGAAHMPHPVVTIDDMTLKEGIDYALSYSSNVNCGTAAVTITGIGNYSGVASSTFEITQCSLDDAVIGDIPNATYTMNTDHTSVAHEPSPVVTIGNRRLVKDIEYDLSYENNTQAGKATVKVTGKGNYKGEVESNFTIDPRDISNAFISPLPDQNMIVGGNTPLPTVNVDGIIVSHDTDFVVEYKNNTDVGEATLTVKGIGNYKGQKSMNFNIIAAPFDFNTSIKIDDQVYTGSEVTPVPNVSIGTKTLEMDKDFVVEYADNINAGRASLTIYGIGSYSGSKTATFNITARPLSSEGIDFLDIEEQMYAGGSYIRPEIKLSDRGKILDESDFYVSYSNNREAGSATVSIVGAGNYQGNIKTNFTIAPKPVTDNDVSVQILENSAFTGEEQKPQVVVKWGGTTLNEGTDYELEYLNNVNAATVTSDVPPTIVVKGKGNYGDEKRVLFTIFQKSLSKASIDGLKDATYTGSPITRDLTVKLGDVTLVEGTDYEVTYDDTNVDAGIATATVRGINNYQDTVAGTFKIAAKSLAGSSIAAIPNQPYTGATITPEVTITNGDQTLVKDKDFTISRWTNNVNAGTASFTVIGIGNYTGTLTSGRFTITKKDLSDCTASAPAQTFTGSALTPTPTLMNGDTALSAGTDFTVDGYTHNVNVGTGTVTVTGQGNYTGDKQISFAIGAKNISTATITAPAAQEYTGAALSPRPTVKSGNATLVFGVDYTLTWSNNVNVGTGTVTITGKGNYTGTARSNFTIKAMDISSATVGPIASMIYTGAAQSPAVALTNDGKTLVEGKDFEVSYDNNVNAGNANVVITGKGNYAGTLGSSFVITKGTDTITGGTKSKSFKAKNLKKKAATFTIGAKGNGTLKYKASKYVKVGKITAAKAKKAVKIASNGKVTVAKKTAKGTYKVEVTITSTGNPNLNGGTLKLVLQVKVS